MESVRYEFVVVDLAVHFLVELGHDLVDLFLVKHHVAEPEDVPEFWHGQIPCTFRVHLLESTPQVTPVTYQL